jgi:hypothetical protein
MQKAACPDCGRLLLPIPPDALYCCHCDKTFARWKINKARITEKDYKFLKKIKVKWA